MKLLNVFLSLMPLLLTLLMGLNTSAATDPADERELGQEGVTAERQGGRDGGGGSFKSPLSFGLENMRAIADSKLIIKHLGLSLEVTEIKLVSKKIPKFVYRVSADTVVREDLCVFDVTVINDHPTPHKDVLVQDLKVVQGCGPIEPKKVPSVLTEFKEYFAQFPKGTNWDQKYSDYVEIARKTPIELRRKIIEFMKTSSEAKYYQVYSQKAWFMRAVLQNYADTTTVEAFYGFLGHEIMGLDISNGIVMPVLIGLSIAPLFMVGDM